MMISTKGRYALRVMIDLAQNSHGEYVSLSDIANRQEISVKYLEAVIAILNRCKLVESRKGKKGGYRLAREPEQYQVGEILTVTEGPLAPVSCLECETNPCSRADSCVTLPLWKELNGLISDYLHQVTLKDLIEGNVKRH